MRRYADIFKALSDETRLAMLALLVRHGELCVCDFVEVLAITHSKASRHLRYLRNAGLLHDRRDAVWVHYRMADDAEGEAREVLRALPRLLEKVEMKELERSLRAWRKRKGSVRCAAVSPPPARRRSRTMGRRESEERT